MSLLPDDLSRDMLESLATDIKRDPLYHSHRLETFGDDFRSFLEQRADQLLAASDSPTAACLALVAEVDSLAERAEFGLHWSVQAELPDHMRNLGQLPIRNQLKILDFIPISSPGDGV